MTQPTPFTRSANFTDYSAAFPLKPQRGDWLDAEFNAAKVTLDELCTNIALIQRDDGKLRNASVNIDQLADSTMALIASQGWVTRGQWLTATVYALGNVVQDAGSIYVCMAAHTSGTFATDVAANRFVKIFDASVVAGEDVALRAELEGATGAEAVSTRRTGTSAVIRTVASKLADRPDLRDFGNIRRRQDTANEYTAEIQAALDQLYSEGVTAVCCDESYTVAGSVTQPSSVAIYSSAGVSRWFEGSPAGELIPPGFYKPSTGMDGPLLIRGVGSHLIGISLDHQKIGGATAALGGMTQFGPLTDATFNNTLTINCHFRGHEINEATGLRRGSVNYSTEFGLAGTDCTAIVFPVSTLGNQRYWHNFINPYIENCRRGFMMNNQGNGCFVSGFRFRGVYRPVWLKGGANECIENIFDGVWAQNYALPTQTQTGVVVAALPEADYNIAQADVGMITNEDLCRLNQYRGPTEGGGRLFILSSQSANAFSDARGMMNNERFTSAQPPGWALPINQFDGGKRAWGPKHERFIALDASVQNASQGWRNKFDVDALITTNLPLTNGSAGLPTTGNASRVITKWTLPDTVSRQAAPFITIKTLITVDLPGGSAGTHSTEIEWVYRVSDNATLAGALWVKKVDQFPPASNYVVGMHFIKGTTGATRPFAISVTLGNGGGAAPSNIGVSHDGRVNSTNLTLRPMAEFADFDFASVALTTDDVADAVSMLATGITTI
jgi:hypothetical protein